VAELLVDPAVSRAKFEREITDYKRLLDGYVRRGIWLVDATFPDVFVVFGVPHVKPNLVLFGATINFQNFDLWPPSVRLVDPFTRSPYSFEDAPTKLAQRMDGNGMQLVITPQGPVTVPQQQPLLQPSLTGDPPFICIRGTREFHEHPAHSGEDWLLYRTEGYGTLAYLLEQLHKYGVAPVRGFVVELVPTVTGLDLGEPPR
jgi:hypothetical protein